MRLFHPAAVALALALASPVARGHSVTDSASASRTNPTNASPRSGSSGDTAAVSYDLDDDWSLDLGAGLTHENATPPPQGSSLKAGGGNIAAFNVGADRTVGTHLMFSGTLNLSPPTTVESATTVTLTDKKGASTDADGLIRSRTRSAGLALALSWDSAGESAFEENVLVLASGTQMTTDQKLAAIETRQGAVNRQELKDSCAAAKGAGAARCKKLKPLLSDLPASLGQGSVGAIFTATLWQTTEVSVGGDLFAYSEDPGAVGIFSVASVGRNTASLGNGVPLAPMSWDASGALAHKFGDLKISLNLGYGRYLEAGDSRSASVKLAYRFSRTWKAWLKAGTSNDVDADGSVVRSPSATVGVRCSWDSPAPPEPDDDAPAGPAT